VDFRHIFSPKTYADGVWHSLHVLHRLNSDNGYNVRRL
jgi:hypothetical protein